VNSRHLDTIQEPVACAVCGRTLLRGEHANVFIAGGARRDVCELCTARAAHEGWIREGADTVPAPRPRERARSLVGRLRTRRDDAAPAAPEPERPSEPLPGVPVELPRRVHAIPTNAEMKVARALELFNGSQHTRTVAGVARSLGAPAVAVQPLPNGGLVEIVVAWELCWYRYEVDLTEEADAVQLLAQGDELSELGEEALLPNAAADAEGALLPAGG
jgi:hypothetical protein